MKKVFSIVLAVSVAATLCVGALAADYGDVSNTPSIGSGVSEPASVVSPSTVNTAITEGKEVSVTSNAPVSQSVVESMAKATAPVVFSNAAGKLSIDPKSITNPQNINVGFTNNSPAAQATFETYFSNNISTVELAQTGSFGATAEITVTPGKEMDLSKNIMAYSYDKATNTYSSLGAAKVNPDGTVTVSTKVGGTIILSEGALVRK